MEPNESLKWQLLRRTCQDLIASENEKAICEFRTPFSCILSENSKIWDCIDTVYAPHLNAEAHNHLIEVGTKPEANYINCSPTTTKLLVIL